MEFWRSRLQIFQDLTHIIPLPLCWDSVEYFKEARPAPSLVCLLDIPGLSSIKGCSGKILTLGTLDTSLTTLTSRIFWPIKKCMFPFIVGERFISRKSQNYLILLLFRFWILQSSGSSWQYIKEWVYVSFCATADPKFAARDSGCGE